MSLIEFLKRKEKKDELQYGVMKCTKLVLKLIKLVILDVDDNILEDFWPKEIKFIKEEYRTIPFPFKEIDMPKFKMTTYSNMYQLVNYMQTWSAVKKIL